MEQALIRMQIGFRSASYIFTNTDSDDYYCSHLRNFLTEDNYDAVFSFNFIPIIADVCHEMHLPYIAWNYDAGWEFLREDALFYPTNYIFHFDKRACKDYISNGYKNIIPMPLAVNCHRLDAMVSTPTIIQQYSSQVTFLGSLYDKDLRNIPSFFQYLDANDASKLMNYIQSHDQTYTTPNIWDTITKEYTDKLNNQGQLPYYLPRLAVLTACASMISGRQRITMLNEIASKYSLDLYTTSPSELVPNANYKWRATYYSQMPYVFRHAQINLNLSLPSIQTGLPLRIFDVLGAGGFLMTNKTSEIEEHFKIGHDIETFETLEELMDKISYYLNHVDIAQKIAANGHQIVQNDFSFEKQFAKILSIVGLI